MIFRRRPSFPDKFFTPAVTGVALSLILGVLSLNVPAHAVPPKAEESSGAQKAVDAARRLIEAGDREQAVQALKNALSESPQGPHVPEAYYLLGRVLVQMGNTDGADAYYRL